MLCITVFGEQIFTFAQQAIQNLPYVTINKSEGYYNNRTGGLISMSSVEEPAIALNSWNLSGEVKYQLFRANEAALFNYLQHDDENNQIYPNVDTTSFQKVTEGTIDVFEGYGNAQRLDLPLSDSGIWYLTLESGESKNSAFILRSQNGLMVQEGKNELIVWGQKFSDLRKLPDAQVTLYDTKNGVRVLGEANLNEDGIATLPSGLNADFIALRSGGDLAIAPVNLQFLNVNYSYQRFNYETEMKHFVFTDRPLYRPGGQVYFKAIIRNDDDARYSTATGLARVLIYVGWDKEERIYDAVLPINSNGAIDGEFTLPEDLTTGDYTIYVAHESEDIEHWSSGSTASFQVEHFRKPEYTLQTESSTLEVVKGDSAEFVVTGEYFSGQPLSNQTVSYSISARDAYGRANILVDTSQLAISENRVKVLTLTTEFSDSSGNPVIATQNMILYPGEFSIYRSDYNYTGATNNNYELALELVPNGDYSVRNMAVSVDVRRSWWDETAVSAYNRREEKLSGLSTTSDRDGKIRISYKPTNAGSYTFTVNVTDERGNTVTKEFAAWIRSDSYNRFSDGFGYSDDLSISTDKPFYTPGDIAKVNIASKFAFRDVLLTLQRDRVDRYQVVSLNSQNTEVLVPIIDDDMPNTYLKVSSFISHDISTTSTEIEVPADKKKITVEIETDRETYGPGQTAVVTVITKDQFGNPVPAEVTLWSVDKAIFELAYDRLNDIYDYFWSKRYFTAIQGHSLEGIRVDGPEGGGGCFLADTQVLMSNGETKNIQDVQVGEYVLSRSTQGDTKLIPAQVLETHAVEEEGYLVINQSLRVTPNHSVFINGKWSEIGFAQIGDVLVTQDGTEVLVSSIEWILGKHTVYNLEVENTHTYFANGIWVHNQKGDTRSVFKDTAYWNPSLQTGDNGTAQVTVPLPDNLTTWVFTGIAANNQTQVGQGTTEIKVSKELVIRPVLPNLLRTGDQIDFSALISNFTDSENTFTATLAMTGAVVEQALKENIEIVTQSVEEVFWSVVVRSQAGSAEVTAKVESAAGKVDEVIQAIPIVLRGFSQKKVFVGRDAQSFELAWSKNVLPENSKITIDLSSTKVGTLPSAMRYLIAYPYGCVEQTTSRFVPVLLANENKELFASVIAGKDLDDMVKKGISRLESLQHSRGSWSWWSSAEDNIFITSYVVEYLLKARSQGYDVPESLVTDAHTFLTTVTDGSLNSLVFKTYALQLLGDELGERVFAPADLEKMDHDVLPYAVIVNYNNGVRDTAQNGADMLLSYVQIQGESAYWEAGDADRFSSIDGTTAIAIRALLLADPQNELIDKAANYLTAHRTREYWTNTFATVQVARAMLDYSQARSELDADYSYVVKLDDVEVATGQVSGSTQLNQTLEIDPRTISESGSMLTVEKQGRGQIYSTIVMDEFHTQAEPHSENNKLRITREYVTERGYEYAPVVGDLVTVELTIEGLDADSPYILIEDELPAGLIPINTNLANQSNRTDSPSFYRYWETREFTQNGVRIALRRVQSTKHVITYTARAIASGTFYAPPARVENMYVPEITAHTQDAVVTVTQDPEVIRDRRNNPDRSLATTKDLRIFFAVVLMVSLSALGFIGWKKRDAIMHQLVLFKQKIQKPKE